MKLVTVLLIAGLVLLSTVFVHAYYQKISAGECVIELPPKILVSSEPVEQTITSNCRGGILFQPPELNSFFNDN